MKLTGELKAKVESAAGMEEKKALIAEAGMELNDEELAAVAGGVVSPECKRRHVFEKTPVFRSSQDPNAIDYLSKGDTVFFFDGSETIGGPDLISYSPLILIIDPVYGYIPKSAIEK